MQKEALMTRYIRYNDTLRKIERLEREGKAYVFYPEDAGVRMTEKERDKLMEQYVLGHEQAYGELPLLRRFLEKVKKEKALPFLKSEGSKMLLNATSEHFKGMVSELDDGNDVSVSEPDASNTGLEKGKATS